MSTSPVNPLSPIVARTMRWSLTAAILLTLAGVLAVILPVVTGVAVTLVIGWIFSMVGILHFVFAWKTHSTRGVLWELLLGFVYLVTGVYLIVHPVAGLTTLTLLLAGYLLFKGALEIVQFFQLQPRHGSGWLLADGIISLVLAILIWRSWPSSSVWVIGTLLGLSMIFAGVSRLMLTLSARRLLQV